MDGEPPAKRARRTDSAKMWDKNGADGTASSRPPTTDRDQKSRAQHEESRNGIHTSRRDDDRRRRSRSPKDRRDTNRRSRSPRDRDRDRDRGYRERDRGGAHDRDSDGHRDRSRSRDRHRSSRDQKPERRRSRSPFRNGTSVPSSRPRSPTSHARMRSKPDDRDVKPPRDAKPVTTNGSSVPPQTAATASTRLKLEAGMDVDDPDEADVLLKRMMGFSMFKSTQNTKVPGNQIYGVRKEKKTEYRQYMNRMGGFNRPLSPGK